MEVLWPIFIPCALIALASIYYEDRIMPCPKDCPDCKSAMLEIMTFIAAAMLLLALAWSVN